MKIGIVRYKAPPCLHCGHSIEATEFRGDDPLWFLYCQTCDILAQGKGLTSAQFRLRSVTMARFPTVFWEAIARTPFWETVSRAWASMALEEAPPFDFPDSLNLPFVPGSS